MADTTPPQVVFSDSVSGTLNRSSSWIIYGLNFNESVTGLATDDFVVQGGSVIAVFGEGSQWQAYVVPTAESANTQMTVTLKAGAVTDAAGNLNAVASNSAQAMNMLAPAPPKLVQGSDAITVDQPQVTLTMIGNSLQTNVVMVLFPDEAPQTVANFLAYTALDAFDTTIFHRLIRNFVLQGGGLIPGLVSKAPLYGPILLETNNTLSNVRGSVAMARTDGPNTATNQFFINLSDNSSLLDYTSSARPGYAVFGLVIQGMDFVDYLAGSVPTTTVGPYSDVPQSYIYTSSANITTPGLLQSRTGVFNLSDLKSGGQWSYSLDAGQTWLAGSGTQLVVPAGHYDPNQVQVQQVDSNGRLSFAPYAFPSELKVGAPAQNSLPQGTLNITGNPRPGQELSLDIQVTDADGVARVSYQWSVDGLVIRDADTPNYTVRSIDAGRQLTLTMSYLDGWGTTETVQNSTTVNADDSLVGGIGNDTLTPGVGNDTVVGGDGIDTVVLPLFPASYSAQIAGNTVILTSGAGTVQLQGIEQLQFGKTYTTTLPLSQFASGPDVATQVNQLTDLYLAFFGRAPDVAGLEYWVKESLNGGKSLAQIAKDFSWSNEAQALFPTGYDNRSFVQLVYNNCFDRQPDEGGWAYWTERLNQISPQDPDFLHNRGLFVGQLLLGAYAPTSGQEDQTLLSHRHDVALHYANLLANTTGSSFDTAINTLLARVDGTEASLYAAMDVLDHVALSNVTLAGVMNNPVLLAQLWTG